MTEMMQHIMQAMAHQQKAQTALYSSKIQQARTQQQMRMMQHSMNTNHPQLPHEGFGHIPQSMPQGFGASLIRGVLGIPPGLTSLKYENGIPFDEA